METKGLPANPDAERMVLGSILLDDSWLSKAAADLRPDDFSLDKHRRILTRMQELHERGERVDRVTVANELLRYNELETCDGLSYLVSLDDNLPQVVNLGSYVNIIKDKAALRRIIYLSQKTMQLAMAGEHPPAQILHQLGTKVAQYEVKHGGHSPLMTIREAFDAAGGLGSFLTAIKMGLPTGFQQIDNLIMGLQPAGQYVIAGHTGSGKTALAQNIAVNLARAGYPGAIFSIEMSRQLLIARSLCSEARVPLKAYIRGDMDRDQRAAINKAAVELADLPLYIDETPGLTITELAMRVNRAVTEKKIKFFVLDYLQLLDWQSDKDLRFRTEYDAVTYASKSCRLLARRHDLASIILSQLSRPADKRKPEERPKLADLRMSGQIEQDAFAVLFVYRPELYQPGKTDLRGVAEIIVGKGRMGGGGKVAHLVYQGRFTRFEDHGVPEGKETPEDG